MGGGFSSCLQVQALIGEVAGSLWQDRSGSAGSRAVPRCLCAPKRWLPLGLASDPQIRQTRERAKRLPPRWIAEQRLFCAGRAVDDAGQARLGRGRSGIAGGGRPCGGWTGVVVGLGPK